MDIKIIGEHLEVTDAMREYILKKLSHLHIPDKMIHAEFRLGKEGKGNHRHHAKFSANYQHKNITIDVLADDSYHAIDNLVKKIHVSLLKQKNQNKTHLDSFPVIVE